MDVFKKIATVSVLVSVTSAASLLHAAPNDTSAQASNNQAIDDVAAITRVGQDNEAINDAVLGNDAINDGVLNNDAINPRAANGDDIAVASADDTASSNAPAPVPRTSSAQGNGSSNRSSFDKIVRQHDALHAGTTHFIHCFCPWDSSPAIRSSWSARPTSAASSSTRAVSASEARVLRLTSLS